MESGGHAYHVQRAARAVDEEEERPDQVVLSLRATSRKSSDDGGAAGGQDDPRDLQKALLFQMENDREKNCDQRLGCLHSRHSKTATCQMDATCAGENETPTRKITWLPNMQMPAKIKRSQSGRFTSSLLKINYI